MPSPERDMPEESNTFADVDPRLFQSKMDSVKKELILSHIEELSSQGLGEGAILDSLIGLGHKREDVDLAIYNNPRAIDALHRNEPGGYDAA